MATRSEVRAHLGVGYSSFARAHLGREWEEAAPSVPLPLPGTYANLAVVPGTYFAPAGSGQPSGFGGGGAGGYYQMAIQRQLPLQLLEHAAQNVPGLSRTERLRTWTSTALTAASQRGEGVATERELAQVLLHAAQGDDLVLSSPIARATQLAAAYTAVGLPTTLALHTPTRFLVTVWADGRWYYADPSSHFELGEHVPFETERFATVPPLDPPPASSPAPAAPAPAPPADDWREQLHGLRPALDQLLAQQEAQQQHAAWQEQHRLWTERYSAWQEQYLRWAQQRADWEEQQAAQQEATVPVADPLAQIESLPSVEPVAPAPPTWIWWALGFMGVAVATGIVLVARTETRAKRKRRTPAKRKKRTF